MPLREYRCTKCGHLTERLERSGTDIQWPWPIHCNEPMPRLLSAASVPPEGRLSHKAGK